MSNASYGICYMYSYLDFTKEKLHLVYHFDTVTFEL